MSLNHIVVPLCFQSVVGFVTMEELWIEVVVHVPVEMASLGLIVKVSAYWVNTKKTGYIELTWHRVLGQARGSPMLVYSLHMFRVVDLSVCTLCISRLKLWWFSSTHGLFFHFEHPVVRFANSHLTMQDACRQWLAQLKLSRDIWDGNSMSESVEHSLFCTSALLILLLVSKLFFFTEALELSVLHLR